MSETNDVMIAESTPTAELNGNNRHSERNHVTQLFSAWLRF
jgi:hypothetical protein